MTTTNHAGHRSGPRRATIALAALVFMLAASLGARHARADAARAREHFELGKRYFQVDEYRKAIEEFKAAHIEEPDPAFLYNIAECHRRLGESREALTFYRRYLALSPPNAPSRPVVERRIAELEAASSHAAKPTPARPEASRPAAAPPPVAPPPLPRAPPPPPTTSSAAVTIARPAPDASTDGAPADGSRPFYKRGWFYVALGAVLVGGAVGAWVLSSSGGTKIPDTPLGNQTVVFRQ